MLTIQSRIARALIGDPVMAAVVLLDAEMDVYQRARLRHWWFTPMMLDHSGVATAKTETAIIFELLRLLLLPNPSDGTPRIVTHYFPRKGLADEEYLPRFERYVSRSNLLFRQLRLQHGRRLWRQMEGCVRIQFLSGALLDLPAGDFMKDSQNQASKSFNDLVVDEAGEIDKSSKGIDRQLLSRARLRCYNPFHPVWANHKLLLGHAEDPSHPYYKRQKAISRAVRDGSQDHGSFTACYLDYRGKVREKYGEVAAKQADEQRSGLSEAEFNQIWLGLWARGSKTWYPQRMIDDCRRDDLRVMVRRPEGDTDTVFALGNDSAPGLTAGADWNSWVVWAGSPVDPESITPETDLTGLHLIGERIWFVRMVYALLLHGASVDQRSGVMHRVHRDFSLSGVGMDPGGGGADVYRKLPDRRQLIDNEWVEVRGMCARRDGNIHPMADPIVSFYDRSDPDFRLLMGDRYLKDNSGPVDFAHTEFRSAMKQKRLALPPSRSRLGEGIIVGMDPEEARAQLDVDRVCAQFAAIRCKTDREGSPDTSSNGYRRFTAGAKKKDGAMAAIYGYHKLIMVLAGARPVGDESGEVMGVFS